MLHLSHDCTKLIFSAFGWFPGSTWWDYLEAFDHESAALHVWPGRPGLAAARWFDRVYSLDPDPIRAMHLTLDQLFDFVLVEIAAAMVLWLIKSGMTLLILHARILCRQHIVLRTLRWNLQSHVITIKIDIFANLSILCTDLPLVCLVVRGDWTNNLSTDQFVDEITLLRVLAHVESCVIVLQEHECVIVDSASLLALPQSSPCSGGGGRISIRPFSPACTAPYIEASHLLQSSEAGIRRRLPRIWAVVGAESQLLLQRLRSIA